jgi:hypothetical protein
MGALWPGEQESNGTATRLARLAKRTAAKGLAWLTLHVQRLTTP